MAPELLDEFLVGIRLEAPSKLLQALAYLGALAARRGGLEVLEALRRVRIVVVEQQRHIGHLMRVIQARASLRLGLFIGIDVPLTHDPEPILSSTWPRLGGW
jgi:hypothetical protein